MKLTAHRTFGNAQHPTIYYFTGYGGTIVRYLPHIYSLVYARFRVVAFEYHKDVLASGNPQTLIDALRQVQAAIAADALDNRRVAGVYGISLGTWFAQNCMRTFNIRTGVFNSAGVSVAHAIWHRPKLHHEKNTFQKQGYTLKKITQAWAPYDIAALDSRFSHRRLLVMNTIDDEVIDIRESRATMTMWRKQGNEVVFMESKGLNHALSIVRNMFRARLVSGFFSSTAR